MQTDLTNPPENRPPRPTRQIGVSRPPLEVEDLPTPEQVYRIKRVGIEELALFILGPSLIALAVSIGSGEWLLGPLNLGQFGFEGLGWVILVSAILQVFYNVELARFTLATGETPIVAFGRTPPGALLWIPLALFSFYLAFILGGWAVSAGTSLFALFTGRLNTPGELETVRLLGVGLLAFSLIFFLFGRKVERTLEVTMGGLLTFMLVSLITVSITVVTPERWSEALGSIFVITAPPSGADVSMIGAIAGFTALAAGLNFMFIGYYRDKGYGMGSRMGALPGFLDRRSRRGEALHFPGHGKTFAETESNARTWRRWFRYLLIDQWGIYFIGALIGMIVPAVLVYDLVSQPGAPIPDSNSIFLYAAQQLGTEFGPILFGWSLLMGFLMLFTTQVVILELLARNLTDAVFSGPNLIRRWAGENPRRFYFGALVALVAAISALIHLALPLELIVLSANLSNLAAMIFPLALLYLNHQLPKPARPSWIYHLALLANVIFFGFFFVNFLVTQLTGTPLVRF